MSHFDQNELIKKSKLNEVSFVIGNKESIHSITVTVQCKF